MHILLGLLTTIATILYFLDRVGVDIGWLNPFHWRRRRAWSQRYHGDPIYSVEDPLHIAALLIVGVAKLEGDLTSEQKKALLKLFSEKFSLDNKEASDLLGSAAHLLAAPQLIDGQLNQLAERNKASFSREQAESMLQMMNEVASVEGDLTMDQRAYVEKMRTMFAPQPASDGTWQ